MILCCSAPPACSSTPLRPSLHYPSMSRRKYNVSSALLPCRRLTPRRHRQADGQLSPLNSPPCQVDAVLFRSSCLFERSSLRCPSIGPVLNIIYIRKYKGHFAVNTNIKSLICLWTQWVHSQRRSQFKQDYCRGADRAPQIKAGFTRDRRRTHWHIVGETWTGPKRFGNGRESALRVQA